MTRKLRNDGRLISIEDEIPELKALLTSKPEVVAAYIYGSYGTGDQTPLSDVDIAVLFHKGKEPNFTEHLDLIEEITRTAREEDVSISVLNTLPIISQFEIVSRGRMLYLGDTLAHADFLEQVLDYYGDFSLDYATFVKEYDAALVEVYAGGSSRQD